MYVFDQVPTDSKVFGDRPDRAELEHIEHRQGKRANKTVGPDHKRQRRPPHLRTFTALHAVDKESQQTFLASDRTHLEPPPLLSFENSPFAPTTGTVEDLLSHFDSENNCVCEKIGRFVFNTLQPKSVVKYRRGHGSRLLRSVRLASNNTDGPCQVHFLFSKIFSQVRNCRKALTFWTIVLALSAIVGPLLGEIGMPFGL